MTRLILCCLALAATLPSQGTLTVQVTWAGEVPSPSPIVIPEAIKRRSPADAALCGECVKKGALVDESTVVDPETRGLRDVAVMVQGPPPPKDAKLAVGTLDNAQCRFQPRVQFVPIGRKVTVTNSDSITHNARIVGRGNRQLWNSIIPTGKPVKTVPIPTGGTYRVICDLHPWMEAWLIGTSSPWVGVTDVMGNVTIKGLPVGSSLVVHLWHPVLGRARLDCQISGTQVTLKRLTQKEFKKR